MRKQHLLTHSALTSVKPVLPKHRRGVLEVREEVVEEEVVEQEVEVEEACGREGQRPHKYAPRTPVLTRSLVRGSSVNFSGDANE